MRTVKEISAITGVSVRTLHYYDEIDLLKPTEKSEAGYRLYDDKALETLQQILFFREFDIPLKEIKAIMDNPVLDRNKILKMQRKMLTVKKERLERLILSIDNLLKGENNMDFEVFTKTEIEELCQITIDHMPDFLKESITKEFGGVEQWKKHYIERASKEDMQKGYKKAVEWYGGDREHTLERLKHPVSAEAAQAYVKRMEAVLKKLTAKKDQPADSSAVKEVVGEYGFIMKQLCQIDYEEGIMLQTASSYRNEMQKSITDQKYGEGASEFFAQAIEAFYKKD